MTKQPLTLTAYCQKLFINHKNDAMVTFMPFAGQLILPDGGDLHGRQPHPAAPAEGREQRLGQPIHRPIRGAILLICQQFVYLSAVYLLFKVRPAWDLAGQDNPECLGIVWGLVGKLTIHQGADQIENFLL